MRETQFDKQENKQVCFPVTASVHLCKTETDAACDDFFQKTSSKLSVE